ncbi:hypothetical protein GDO81_017951 [Engystomops pustulosus]|uniref:Secreted protein n=1 Tax=Engystomops pustulosus TaxID=76066 RepID=A0AAV7A3L5_ENGPU|nr:hypothetical protein GDO81_017951 [Engystomops pustulosus]
MPRCYKTRGYSAGYSVLYATFPLFSALQCLRFVYPCFNILVSGQAVQARGVTSMLPFKHLLIFHGTRRTY